MVILNTVCSDEEKCILEEYAPQAKILSSIDEKQLFYETGYKQYTPIDDAERMIDIDGYFCLLQRKSDPGNWILGSRLRKKKIFLFGSECGSDLKRALQGL